MICLCWEGGNVEAKSERLTYFQINLYNNTVHEFTFVTISQRLILTEGH